MAGEKFYLNFLNDGFGKVQIDEPIGWNTLSFDFMQKDKGYGRDILFNGGESQLEFTSYRNHYLNKLLYYNHYYGFESNIEISVDFTDGTEMIQSLDFSKAETDDYETFKCKMIQKNALLIINRRADVNVDLFSIKDYDGNPIDPVPTSKILLKPKSVFQHSRWEQGDFTNVDLRMHRSGSADTAYYILNPAVNIVKSDIANTFTFFEMTERVYLNTTGTGGIDGDDFCLIQADNLLRNLKLTITGLTLRFEGHKSSTSIGTVKGYADIFLYLKYGTDADSATQLTLYSGSVSCTNEEVITPVPRDYNISIPYLKKGDKIWLYYYFKVRKSSAAGSYVSCIATITNMNVDITADYYSYYSITKGIRLIDAIKQVIKSISGSIINAPIFDVGSIYYDTFLLNGNLLRGLIGDITVDAFTQSSAFYLSLNDIANSITECNADYEVNDTVFFGTERDFYAPIECGFFDTIQFQDFTKTYSDRMSILQFSYKYKNYQALKENELPQTADTVHGESILTLFNKNVENIKDINIDWIRDSFLIEEARQKSFIISTDTSYQNDNSIFALDTIALTEDIIIQEIIELKHEYTSSDSTLTLRSATASFILIGIEVGVPFSILAPDKNAGNYIVKSVLDNTLELTANGAKPNSNNDGIRNTFFEYTVSHISFPLINYTTENITNIAGTINDPDSFSNLRFSIRRNVENYYSEYLSTCNQYWKDKPLRTTWYKNNVLFTCTYDGLTTLEGGDYIPTNKILTPYLYDKVIFANIELSDFFTLQNNLRINRGYVRTIDKNNNVIKLFPTKMNYQILSKELTLTGEEKFEPSQMTISTANQDILINNETSVHTINYQIIDNKLFIYDNHRQLLYNGVFWDKVTINGANAQSLSELDDLMKLVQSKNN